MQRLLSITTLLVLSACASGQLPAAPEGQTCIGDVAAGGFDCVKISKAEAARPLEQWIDVRHPQFANDLKSLAEESDFVPFGGVDNWVAFDPNTWSNVQAYIGYLKVLAQRNCQK